MEGFTFKSQGGNSLELGTHLEWSSWAISGSLGIHGTEASNLDGGWGYRGYEGAHARLGLEVPFSSRGSPKGGLPTGDTPAGDTQSTAVPLGKSGQDLGFQAGVGGGGGAFFSRYRETDLVFFYPSVYAFLFLDHYTTSPRVRIRYTIPFEWYFRKDLAASFSLGISIGVMYTWTQPRGGNR